MNANILAVIPNTDSMSVYCNGDVIGFLFYNPETDSFSPSELHEIKNLYRWPAAPGGVAEATPAVDSPASPLQHEHKYLAYVTAMRKFPF
jgi:hypothetical protein